MRDRLLVLFIGLAILLCIPQGVRAQWVQTNGPEGCEVTALAVDGSTVFAVIRGLGVYMTTDNGARWTAVTAGLPPGTEVTCLVVGDGKLFAGTESGRVIIFADGGARWKAADRGLPEDASITSLAMIGQSLFAIARREVFVSTDNGAGWKRHSKGLSGEWITCLVAVGRDLFAGLHASIETGPTLPKFPILASFSALAQSLYAMGPPPGGALFLSTDGVSKWRNTKIRFSSPIECLARIGEDLFVGTDSGLYWCKNYAESSKALKLKWSEAKQVRCLSVIGQDLLVGTQKGVLIVKKNGQVWVSVDTGFPSEVPVIALVLTETDLYAGTRGRGVWRLPLAAIRKMGEF